jgi:DNA-binding MarR family transcriptional regulator
MIDRFERFSFAISEISRCWHRIAAEEMGRFGLKGPYAVYFTTLSRYPQGISAAQLGELSGRDKADVSRALNFLEDRGFICRDVLPQKAYRAPIRLTEQGQELARQINEKAQIAVEQASAGLTPEKRAVFYEALGLITENLQTLSKNGLPK